MNKPGYPRQAGRRPREPGGRRGAVPDSSRGRARGAGAHRRRPGPPARPSGPATAPRCCPAPATADLGRAGRAGRPGGRRAARARPRPRRPGRAPAGQLGRLPGALLRRAAGRAGRGAGQHRLHRARADPPAAGLRRPGAGHLVGARDRRRPPACGPASCGTCWSRRRPGRTARCRCPGLLAGRARARRPGTCRARREDLAVLLYTSGTSGRPRGAMLTHRALLANLEQCAAIWPSVVAAQRRGAAGPPALPRVRAEPGPRAAGPGRRDRRAGRPLRPGRDAGADRPAPGHRRAGRPGHVRPLGRRARPAGRVRRRPAGHRPGAAPLPPAAAGSLSARPASPCTRDTG